MRKVIITVALNGGVHGKEANPNLPEQPDEIIEQAFQCGEAGAAIVHVHPRDKEGKETFDQDIFHQIRERIARSSDLIVQRTTGGGANLTMEQRIGPLFPKPELPPLYMYTSVFRTKSHESADTFPRSEIEDFAKIIKEMKIKPEIEVMSSRCLKEVDNLCDKGLLDPPYYINMILKTPDLGGLRGMPEKLMNLVGMLPEGAVFSVTCLGAAHLPLTTMGIILGGNLRVGLEDTLYYANGQLAKNNVELVARTVRIAKELNLEIASPDETRQMLGMKE